MRQPAGIAWSEMQVRRWQAMQTAANQDGSRIAALAFACEILEREFEEAVAFERELWAEAVWLKQEADRNERADTTAISSTDAEIFADAGSNGTPKPQVRLD